VGTQTSTFLSSKLMTMGLRSEGLLVLKASLGMSGKQVVIGREAAQAEWEAVVVAAAETAPAWCRSSSSASWATTAPTTAWSPSEDVS
jgi:hypothetical protein